VKEEPKDFEGNNTLNSNSSINSFVEEDEIL